MFGIFPSISSQFRGETKRFYVIRPRGDLQTFLRHFHSTLTALLVPICGTPDFKADPQFFGIKGSKSG
jgi:hypothetical protein